MPDHPTDQWILTAPEPTPEPEDDLPDTREDERGER